MLRLLLNSVPLEPGWASEERSTFEGFQRWKRRHHKPLSHVYNIFSHYAAHRVA